MTRTNNWSCEKKTTLTIFSSATLALLTLAFLVRPCHHAREHRKQRGPRGGGHGGRLASAREHRRRVRGNGRGGRDAAGGRVGAGAIAGRRAARFTHPALFLPLFPAVLGPVQISVLVEHQTDAGRMQSVGFPERRGGVQFLFGHLEQHGTVTECYGHATHLGVL